MMVSKGNTLLAQAAIFNDDIQEWRRKPSDLMPWAKLKVFFHHAHREQLRVVTMSGKLGYMAAVKNIYGVPPPASPEEHNTAI